MIVRPVSEQVVRSVVVVVVAPPPLLVVDRSKTSFVLEEAGGLLCYVCVEVALFLFATAGGCVRCCFVCYGTGLFAVEVPSVHVFSLFSFFVLIIHVAMFALHF